MTTLNNRGKDNSEKLQIYEQFFVFRQHPTNVIDFSKLFPYTKG